LTKNLYEMHDLSIIHPTWWEPSLLQGRSSNVYIR
jgi:hypothetical protein